MLRLTLSRSICRDRLVRPLEALDEMFLATLGRLPTDSDRQLFTEYRATSDRRSALFDTMWALINTREFILNH